MADQSPILAEKKALRARMKVWRAGLDAPAQMAAAEALARHGLDFLAPLDQGLIVSAFAPMAEELRVWPLLRRLAAQGFRLALPVVQGKGLPLIFRAWSAGEPLPKAGAWHIPEPAPDKPVLSPDIVLVPLLAFDRAGWRLGYGGGFYDRTLRSLRAAKSIVAIGLAHDAQQVDAVPHLDYDERLDWVLRPAGPMRCVDQ